MGGRQVCQKLNQPRSTQGRKELGCPRVLPAEDPYGHQVLPTDQAPEQDCPKHLASGTFYRTFTSWPGDNGILAPSSHLPNSVSLNSYHRNLPLPLCPAPAKFWTFAPVPPPPPHRDLAHSCPSPHASPNCPTLCLSSQQADTQKWQTRDRDGTHRDSCPFTWPRHSATEEGAFLLALATRGHRAEHQLPGRVLVGDSFWRRGHSRWVRGGKGVGNAS